MNDDLKTVIEEISRLDKLKLYGRVKAIQGLLIEIEGLGERLAIGERCHLEVRGRSSVTCEIIGFRDNRALAMPFGPLDGVGLGSRALVGESQASAYPNEKWLGRVINALGDPLDGGPPVPKGAEAYPLCASPPPAHQRKRVSGKIDLGVRSINTFITCCRGQRMGIFSGSGVGKSILMSMLTRHSTADVIVLGLIGERGREVKEFIEEDLGPEGLARSVLVVATSNESALMRRQAAFMTMAVAEYFRDQGRDVLCLMDSITRFAMALREIGLSAGEPPASKGYTPTVFSEMPKLLERAGPGIGQGSITGLFTVLVEGDDHNEPISDSVRGIVDGHIVLDRTIAERNRYPAINILRSVSRTLPTCNSADENRIIDRARSLMAVYEDMAELIRLGAYRHGSDPAVDEAIRYHQGMEKFLSQNKQDKACLEEGYRELANILDIPIEEIVEDSITPVDNESRVGNSANAVGGETPTVPAAAAPPTPTDNLVQKDPDALPNSQEHRISSAASDVENEPLASAPEPIHSGDRS